MEHGWLTTLRRDGSPRTSRVWFVETRDAFWIATGVATRKVADLQRDPRASFAIEGRHGAVSTSASLLPIDSEPAALVAFTQHCGGWDAADTGVDGPRVLIRLPR